MKSIIMVTLFLFAFSVATPAQTKKVTPKTKPTPFVPADAIPPGNLFSHQIEDGRLIPANKPVPTPKATTSPEETKIVATIVETPVEDEGGPSTTVILLWMAGIFFLFLYLFGLGIFSESKNKKTQKPIPPPHIRGNY